MITFYKIKVNDINQLYAVTGLKFKFMLILSLSYDTITKKTKGETL